MPAIIFQCGTPMTPQTQEWEPALVREMVAHKLGVIPTLKLWPYELRRIPLPERVVDLATRDAVEELRVFAAAGGQVLFGTDVGYMTDYDPTDEYLLMAQALSPMQILTSLTTAPASRWKESERRGRLDVGMDADLVVLDGDPAKDVRNFAQVRCTIRRGGTIYMTH